MIGLLHRMRTLHRLGILGINQRNAGFVLPHNPRVHYPRVDDKCLTKQLAEAAGIPTPRLLALVSLHHELRDLPRILGGLSEFVLKPGHGAQGNGIAVITEVDDGRYRKSSGAWLTSAQIRQHVANIVSGVFSLQGDADRCLVEALVTLHPAFEGLATQGIPDVRVIVYRGFPVMAMCRLPTRGSDGRANLHQGAIAVGLDLASGRSIHAAHHNWSITRHVDSQAALIGFPVPLWDDVLALATRASEITYLGYVGVDIVIDPRYGPQLLEFNARPGLGIQVANNEGLLPRLRRIDALAGGTPVAFAERCGMACDLFRRAG